MDRALPDPLVVHQSRLLDAVGYAVIGTDLAGEVIAWNHAAELLYGWTAAEVIGRNIMTVTPTDASFAQASEIMVQLRQGKAWRGEFEVRDRNHRRFMIDVVNNPVVDGDGELVGIVGVSHDISARKQAERHSQLVLQELHHRLNNTLMSVLAIARQTAKGAADTEDFLSAFESRLSALSRTHALLRLDQTARIDLNDIVEHEAKPFTPARFRRSGDSLLLDAKVGMALAMCLHELAANAAKYGALSNDRGRVDFSWRVETVADGDAIVATWIERDGPAVVDSSRQGFGSILVPELVSSIGGTLERRIGTLGLEVSIRAPLSA